MLKRLFIILMCTSLVLPLAAQQLPQYTQYMFNKLVINPGYAGAGNGICVSGTIRQQWVGFKGSKDDGSSINLGPETYLISIHAPIKALRGGIGATIQQDKIGPFNDIYFNVMYAYQTTLGAGDLGIGAQLNILNKTINFGDFQDAGSDPVLGNGEETDMYFDAGIGLYYRVPDNYYVGISVTNLLQSKKDVGTHFNMRREIDLMAGYEFEFPNLPAIDILPSVLIKAASGSIQYDLTALLRYQRKFWGGVSWRYQDAVALIVGFDYKNFNIGYSYDFNTSAIGTTGSHEIRASYCFKIEVDKVKKIYRNTRFL
ncbi:MAG: type IX secretion system membrane protein PorP/SprF [Bacteroidales bacterium]|nr:type IX secretion system membrane protein PorP/SprF [Bacteroidales bacterium]